MTASIEMKWKEIVQWIQEHPDQGHPHYWCGGNEEDCTLCNMDHPKTDLHLAMLTEERALLFGEDASHTE